MLVKHSSGFFLASRGFCKLSIASSTARQSPTHLYGANNSTLVSSHQRTYCNAPITTTQAVSSIYRVILILLKGNITGDLRLSGPKQSRTRFWQSHWAAQCLCSTHCFASILPMLNFYPDKCLSSLGMRLSRVFISLEVSTNRCGINRSDETPLRLFTHMVRSFFCR